MAKSYEFAFRKRYNLPPTDPRFLDATIEEIMADHYAHRAADNPNVTEFDTDDDVFAEEVAAMERDDWEPVT